MRMYQNQNRFIKMRAVEGLSLETISKKLKVSMEILMDWDNEFKDSLHKHKIMEMEKVAEKMKINDIDRFRYFADWYDRLRKELENRDLKEIPTTQLCSLVMSIEDKINSSMHMPAPYDPWDEYPYDDFSEFDDFEEDENDHY
jgi:hypothetical protein